MKTKGLPLKKSLIGFILAFILLFLAFRDVNFNKVITSLLKIDLVFLLASILAFYSGVFIRVVRSLVFIEAQGQEVDSKDYFVLHLFAGFFNRLVPLGFGEFYRVLAANKAGIKKSGMIPVIYVTGVLDLVFLLIIGTVSVLLGDLKSYILIQALILGFLFTIGALSLLFVFLRKGKKPKFLFKFPFFKKFEDKIEEGLETVRRCFKEYSIVTLFIGFLSTVLIWFLTFLSFFFIILGFGVELDFWFAFLIFGASALLMDIPVTPGGLGLIDLFLVSALSFEISRSLGTSIVLGYRFVNYILFILIIVLLILLKGEFIIPKGTNVKDWLFD